MEKKFKKRIFKFKAEVISPTHIGSGDFLEKNFDYITRKIQSKTEYLIIDENSIYENVSVEDLRATNDIETYKKIINDLFEEKKLRVINSFSIDNDYSRIWTFTEEANIPFIPGSTIKGAFRTAILFHKLNKKIENRERIGRNIEEVFSKEINRFKFQYLQALRVKDSYILKDYIKILPFHTYSLTKRNGEKGMYKKENKTKLAEAIVNQKRFELEVQIYENERDYEDFKNIFDNLDKILKDYYLYEAKREKEFFENWGYKSFKNDIVNFYKNIIEDKENIYIRIGFGTGWNDKTGGELIDNKIFWNNVLFYYINFKKRGYDKHLFYSILKNSKKYFLCPHNHNHKELFIDRRDPKKIYCKDCRKSYDLSELKINFPFPKSRKLVKYNGKYYPPGWIKLKLEREEKYE